jgi:hypothetical protein
MSTSNALMTNAALTQKVTEAALAAVKAGMDKSDVAAVINAIATLIENSDDE